MGDGVLSQPFDEDAIKFGLVEGEGLGLGEVLAEEGSTCSKS